MKKFGKWFIEMRDNKSFIFGIVFHSIWELFSEPPGFSVKYRPIQKYRTESPYKS